MKDSKLEIEMLQSIESARNRVSEARLSMDGHFGPEKANRAEVYESCAKAYAALYVAYMASK